MSDQVHAEHVARKEFSLSFRGFDQHEVRAFLASVAGELSAWEERERTLRARLTELEQRPTAVDELDEATIEAALGETATRIIHAAREAAAEVRTRAEEESTQKLDEAESILAKSTAEAAEANAALRAETDAAVATQREEADRQAASIVAEARAEADSLLADATSTRARMMRELADRRETIVGEIEQLQAARDRLRAAHDSVRTALDVALLDVDAADMRASDILARVKPVEVPPAAMPEIDESHAHDEVDEVVEDLDAPAEQDADDATPAVDGASDAMADDDDSPTSSPAPDERRSSALRLLRPRSEAEGTPTAPPIDDPYEGVRIIRPDVTPEPVPVDVVVPESGVTEEPSATDEGDEDATAETSEEPAPDAADDAIVEVDVVVADEVVDDVVVLDEVVEVVVLDDEPAASTAEADTDTEEELVAEIDAESSDVPVDDLFARLRADRAAALAKATAVLAATDPSPTGPSEEEPIDVTEPVEVAAESPDVAVLSARDAAVADAERSVIRSLKRALADEQNEVLDALRRLRGKPSVDALLPDIAVHEARYDAVLGTGAAAAASAGGELAGGAGDAGEVTAEIGRALAGDLRARVARSIDDAAGDVDTLAEAISATYREWKTSRAEPLARDVIAASFASGTYVAASGPLRWVVDPDEGGCPDCEDNALAGGTPKGTAFPTGQLRPPAHAGCRCALVPVS